MGSFNDNFDMLDCPICYKGLRPPIQTCGNGHGICGDCREKISVCGICKKNFTNAPNTLLNQVVERITLKCKYHSQGCNKILPCSELPDHENICYYRDEYCYSCTTEFPLSKINDHLRDCEKAISSKTITTFSAKIFISCEITEEEEYTYYLIYITDISTHFLMRFVDKREETSFSVQYMGEDQENAGKYKYDIRIYQGLPGFYVCYSGLCVPYIYSDEETEKQRKRIKIDLESVFLTEDALSSKKYSLEITISKMETFNLEEKCIKCENKFSLTKMNDHFKICEISEKLKTTFLTEVTIDCSITEKEEHHYRLIYITSLETYFLWRSISNRDKISFCVQYVGRDQENAGKYQYSIKINQGLPNSYIFCNGLCVPYIFSNEETSKQMKTELNFKTIFLNDSDICLFKKYVLKLALSKVEASTSD